MPWNSFIQESILGLFSEERANWIYWTREQPDKNIITCSPKIAEGSLFDLWVHDDSWIGLRFAKTTRYALIDIDKNSRYRTPEAIAEIIELFAENGIHLTRYQSSESSRGVHLLAAFNDPVKTAAIAALSHYLLDSNGYQVAGGHLEPYPSLLRPKQAVRLPFQAGFCELDEQLKIFDALPGPWPRIQAIRHFFAAQFSDADALPFYKIPHAYTQNTRREQRQADRASRDRLTGEYQEWFKRGELLFNSGLQEAGTRHCALMDVAFYIFAKFHGYGQEYERQQRLQEWIETHHNGFSETWNRKPKQVFREIQDMVYWEPKGGKRGVRTECFTETNMQRRADSRAAILSALPDLMESGEIWKRNGAINLAAIIRMTGKNKRTVYNYRQFIEEQIKTIQTSGCEVLEVEVSAPVHISEVLELHLAALGADKDYQTQGRGEK